MMIASPTFLPTSLNFKKSLGLHNRAYLMFRHGCTTKNFNRIPVRQNILITSLSTTRKACLSLSLSIWMEPRFIFLQPSANWGLPSTRIISFQQHVSCTCQICYFELRRINFIRHYLSQDTLKTLISAFVLVQNWLLQFPTRWLS